MAKTTFSGPVISKNGFIGSVKGPIIDVSPTPVFSGDRGEFTATENPDSVISDSGVLYYSNGTNWVELAAAQPAPVPGPTEVYEGDTGTLDAASYPGTLVVGGNVLYFSNGTDWKVVTLT